MAELQHETSVYGRGPCPACMAQESTKGASFPDAYGHWYRCRVEASSEASRFGGSIDHLSNGYYGIWRTGPQGVWD